MQNTDFIVQRKIRYLKVIINAFIIISIYYVSYNIYANNYNIRSLSTLNLGLLLPLIFIPIKRNNYNLICNYFILLIFSSALLSAIIDWRYCIVAMSYLLILPPIVFLLRDKKYFIGLSILSLFSMLFIAIFCNIFPLSIDHIVSMNLTFTFFAIISVLLLSFIILIFYNDYNRILLENYVFKNEELIKTQNYKSQFFSLVSHDLRTPMNAIMGIGKILNHTNIEDAEHKKLVNSLNLTSEYLLNLINNLLDVQNIDTGNLRRNTKCVHPNDIISEVLDIMKLKSSMNHTQTEVINNIDSHILLEIDAFRYKQILIQLYGNAICRSKNGTVSVSTKIVERGSMHYLYTMIIFKGKSNCKDYKWPIHETINYDEKQKEKYANSELGLHMSRKLAQFLGGDMEMVESDNQSNICTFWIECNTATSKDCKCSQDQQITAKTFNFLLVDDNELNLVMLEKIINKHYNNCTIYKAQSGMDALDILHSDCKIDMIIMDLMMPVMDGFETTQIIRRSTEYSWSQVPIVALSANVSLDAELRSYESGMDYYLSKPLNVSEFKGVIQRLL